MLETELLTYGLCQAYRVRPNRDVARLRLKDVLQMAAQFLDGTLQEIILEPSSSSCSSRASRTKKEQWLVDVDGYFDCIKFASVEFSRHQRFISPYFLDTLLLRLGEIQCPGHKLMLPHFAESLRELGRLGGGLENGEVESQPWPSD